MTKLPHFNISKIHQEPIYGSAFELIFDPISTLMSDECTRYDLDTTKKTIDVTFNLCRDFIEDLFMQFSNIMECDSLRIKYYNPKGDDVMYTDLRGMNFDGFKFGGDYSGNTLLEVTVVWSFTTFTVEFLK